MRDCNWGPWSPELLGERHKLGGGPQTPLYTMTPLCTRPGLATQPRYEAPCDLWVKHRQNTVINIERARLLPQ